jgi:hypothetical protein
LAAVGDKLWVLDATTGQEYRALPRNGGMVKVLAFSPDGHLLASACEQALNEFGTVRINIFDPRSGAYLQAFTGAPGRPDGCGL